MFNRYLPDSLYERLPMTYLVSAAFLIVSPLSNLRWIAVVSLVLAAVVTHQRRRIYRSRLNLPS